MKRCNERDANEGQKCCLKRNTQFSGPVFSGHLVAQISFERALEKLSGSGFGPFFFLLVFLTLGSLRMTHLTFGKGLRMGDSLRV